jgi:hypothetical protein
MFTMKKASFAIAAVAFATSAQAAETAFSYTQLSIAAVTTQFDDDIYISSGPYSYEVYEDIGGAALSGSYQFDNNLILGVSGSYQENSGSHTEINSTGGLYTLGYASPIASSVDIIVQGGLAYTELEFCSYGCYSEDDNGLYLSAGGRGWATSWLELNASASYVDYSDLGSENSFSVGAAGWFNDTSSIFVDLGKADDVKTAGIGYRYTFN